MKANRKKLASCVAAGGAITGAGGGAAVGFILGGPVGAAAGSMLGAIVATASDVAARHLSSRETARVGAAITYACAKIQQRLDAGETLREDGFFEPGERCWSDAEEIFEGVLLKCKNEHEEKKIRLIANILANVAFTTGVSAGEANHLLQRAESLTYRKMCILALIGRRDALTGLELRPCDYNLDMQHLPEDLPPDTISVVQETFELWRSDLLLFTSTPEIRGMRGEKVPADWQDVTPEMLALTYQGQRCFAALGLQDVPEDDIRRVADHLCYAADFQPEDMEWRG